MSEIAMTLKVVFCWSDISGYMATCWRALHQLAQIEVFVIAFQARTETAFADQIMQGIPCKLLDVKERDDESFVKQLLLAQKPDAVVLCGWFHKPYRQLAANPEMRDVVFIMGMDTPWWGTWKQQLAPYLLRSFLKRINRVVVTGERSWQYAWRLGISPRQISQGLYGIDYTAWASLGAARQQGLWPRSFLFVGRYTKAKAIDVLVEAYRYYRTQVTDPWPLVCCGQGPLEKQLEAQPGIENCGFVQPNEMQTIWQNAGAFVLPSRFDPWPLALVEAAAAGLPIICTNICGSAVEVVRDEYNGFIVAENDPHVFAQAMVKLHQQYEHLPMWGIRAQQLAAPYAAEMWASRWQNLLLDACL